jgi:glycosyltransferase involved in cell wall biosynthesis
LKRVLRIINRPAIGGPILNATLLARHLGPEFETLLVAGSCETHEAEATDLLEGLNCIRMDSMGRSINPLKDVLAYSALRKLIREYRPHIVHTHAAKPGALGRLAAKAEGVPVIVHSFHGHVFHSYFNPLKNRIFLGIERYLAKISDAIIAISPEQKLELSEQFRVASADKFRMIPLGFDLDKFSSDQEQKRTRFRSELGIAADVVVITLTGRLVPIKHHAFFLQAFKKLLGTTDRKVLAVFVGDGESRSSIETLADSLGIRFTSLGAQDSNTELILTSWRTDIDVVNAGSDIVALSSLNEGTPVSLIEASAASKPVVSTHIGGVASVVKEGVSGFLIECGDADAFATRLNQLVSDPALRAEFGQAGAEHVRSKFAYQRLVSDMSALYHELLKFK